MDKKILTIGGSGLIGSRVTEILSQTFECKDLSRKDDVDITIPESLKVIEDDTDYQYVILFAAKADVDGCEKDKPQGVEGDAWKLNVDGVANVAKSCLKNNKKLIYISTDFVFDGKNTPEGGYSEDDIPNPINWYSKTKFEGENALIRSGAKYIIVRTSYPYRKEPSTKPDFVHAIASRLTSGQEVFGVSDHIISPSFIDDLADGLKKLIETDSEGIFHVSGSSSLSPFDAAIQIAKATGVDTNLVQKTTREEFFKDRAERPFNLSMKNAKISKLGVSMRSFDEGLKEVFNN